jgi:hypothetical protein
MLNIKRDNKKLHLQYHSSALIDKRGIRFLTDIWKKNFGYRHFMENYKLEGN